MGKENNGGKKIFEERLEAISQAVELRRHMQMATEKRVEALVGNADSTLASIQALQRIAEARDRRITGLEGAV